MTRSANTLLLEQLAHQRKAKGGRKIGLRLTRRRILFLPCVDENGQ